MDGQPNGTGHAIEERHRLKAGTLHYGTANGIFRWRLPTAWAAAGAAVVLHAARDLGLERLVGIVSPGNAASIRVLEKLGLRFEARIRLTPDEEPVRLYARDLALDPPVAGP
mgnify:CR=1 FL=1